MSKGLRLSEKWFARGLWLIAVIFAAFLIGLGSLVVGDLPRVEKSLSAEQFMDAGQLRTVEAQLEDDAAKVQDNEDATARVNLNLQHAREATQSERESFDTWIKTRTATQQSAQDAEVLQRTHTLDELKSKERTLQLQSDALENQAAAIHQVNETHLATKQRIADAGEAGYTRALHRSEMRVFLFRLALTLPLLLLAIWLFLKQRKSPRWPFVWGFIFFALFTFFVELVPYLPSYGGYVRYIVGIVLTVLIGNYAIGALRRYLDAQKAAEQKPEEERRKHLSYDMAQARLTQRVCPGCERPIDTADTSGNFCMHCGLLVYENCPRCSTRQTAFSHFCRACGLTKAAPATAPIIAV